MYGDACINAYRFYTKCTSYFQTVTGINGSKISRKTPNINFTLISIEGRTNEWTLQATCIDVNEHTRIRLDAHVARTGLREYFRLFKNVFSISDCTA